MLQEIAANDTGFHNKVFGMTYPQYRAWLENEYAVDNGKLEDWMVPQSTYWLYDDETPVGCGRLRHSLNDALRETSGHIGYAIASSKRGRGYGNAILPLLLEKCAQLRIRQAQIGANAENTRSNAVILHCGGVLFRQSGGKNFYHIDIPFESI